MVRLTDYEQRMLNGEMGPFKQRALQKIVDYANALGAEELCTVTKATVYFGYHPYLDAVKSDDYNEIFSKMVLCSDKKYELGQFSDECFTQTCAAPCDQFCYEPIGLSKEVFDKNRKFLDLTRDAGVSIVGSCTPTSAAGSSSRRALCFHGIEQHPDEQLLLRSLRQRRRSGGRRMVGHLRPHAAVGQSYSDEQICYPRDRYPV